ncbi:COG4315 family predicted lipoprotein [Streptomyces sp. NPDC002402]
MRTTRPKALLAAPLVAAALLTLAACGGSTDSSDDGGAKPAAKPVKTVSVKTADSELGKILVDDSGRTLYGFTKDKPGASKCDADCIAVWPALTSSKDVKAGSGTDAALLKETKLGEGAEQAVYGDWPLYYYVGDATPGDVNGQGLDGEWFVIAADGKLVKKVA